MRVHVLAGCSELLQPRILTPEEADSLVGPGVRIASAAWLSPSPDSRYHAVLQDEPGDQRTAVMALALEEEFGTRFEPLLVFPGLLDETDGAKEDLSPAAAKRSQLGVLSEIEARGHFRQVRLYGLGLPDEADPEKSWAAPAGIVSSAVRNRLEKLRTTSIAEIGYEAVEARMVEATPDLPIFDVLYNNAICNQIALRLLPRLRSHGWTSHGDLLPRAIAGILKDWGKKGIAPSLPLRAGDLDAMTDLVFEKLF